MNSRLSAVVQCVSFAHNRECRGCTETFRETTKKKKGGEKTARGEKEFTTKGTDPQGTSRRELRPRSHEVRYTSMDEVGDLNDANLPDEIQGYMCVLADPRRSGLDEGRENFILTVKELRMSLRTQSKVEDQDVCLTTSQVGLPTTVVEGELKSV